jgi:hypothetical protein
MMTTLSLMPSRSLSGISKLVMVVPRLYDIVYVTEDVTISNVKTVTGW